MCCFMRSLPLAWCVFIFNACCISPNLALAQQPQTTCPDDIKYLKNECYGALQLTTGRYDGYFVDNEFSGHGHLIFENGDIYDGKFSHHEITGKGELSYIDGSKYVGEFKNGNMNGNGMFADVNGMIFSVSLLMAKNQASAN